MSDNVQMLLFIDLEGKTYTECVCVQVLCLIPNSE